MEMKANLLYSIHGLLHSLFAVVLDDLPGGTEAYQHQADEDDEEPAVESLQARMVNPFGRSGFVTWDAFQNACKAGKEQLYSVSAKDQAANRSNYQSAAHVILLKLICANSRIVDLAESLHACLYVIRAVFQMTAFLFNHSNNTVYVTSLCKIVSFLTTFCNIECVTQR